MVLAVQLFSAIAAIMMYAAGGPEINSEEGKFAITLPEGFNSPTKAESPVETALGTLTMTTYMAQKGNTALTMVAYADYPEEAFSANFDSKKVLDGAQKGALKNMNAKLLSQKNITIDGNPGRSFRFTFTKAGSKFFGQFNAFLVKPRMYQVAYLTTKKSDLDKAEVTEYFSSFNLK